MGILCMPLQSFKFYSYICNDILAPEYFGDVLRSMSKHKATISSFKIQNVRINQQGVRGGRNKHIIAIFRGLKQGSLSPIIRLFKNKTKS